MNGALLGRCGQSKQEQDEKCLYSVLCGHLILFRCAAWSAVLLRRRVSFPQGECGGSVSLCKIRNFRGFLPDTLPDTLPVRTGLIAIRSGLANRTKRDGGHPAISAKAQSDDISRQFDIRGIILRGALEKQHGNHDMILGEGQHARFPDKFGCQTLPVFGCCPFTLADQKIFLVK